MSIARVSFSRKALGIHRDAFRFRSEALDDATDHQRCYRPSTVSKSASPTDQAACTLRDVSPVKLDAALTVRLKDSNSASRLSFRINQLLNRQDAAALLVYSQRTVLMYSNKDGKIMLIDNHQHGEKMGPVIVKGLCSHLPQFLNSIQEVLSMNDTSYAELIVFS